MICCLKAPLKKPFPTCFVSAFKQFLYIGDPGINRKFDKQINTLTDKRDTMGIIETITKIEREEGFEICLKLPISPMYQKLL